MSEIGYPICPNCNIDMVPTIILKNDETGELLQKFYCEECDESILLHMS